MDVRGGSMTGFVIGILLGMGVGYWLVQWRKRIQSRKFLAVAEYWVYIPGEKLPIQDEIMKLLLQGNSPVGPAEGLLLSDIRLHIALVLRSKNPHVFRPDLFDDHLEPTAEQLQKMGESKAVVKIRYLSEERLRTDAHLQLLPYLAYAYCKLANGNAIFDVQAERIMTVPELQARLKEDKNARRPDFHLNIVWKRTINGGSVETRGLVKKGIPELVTAEVHSDERLLVSGLLDEASKSLWYADAVPTEVEIESFNDIFRLILGPAKDGRSEVRIMRVQVT
ncbi:MAG: hypothetical protein H7Y17_16710 [Chlorobia bacterium]|nr:hypothetical protein [Fimbriimonadaceae bacterium]